MKKLLIILLGFFMFGISIDTVIAGKRSRSYSYRSKSSYSSKNVWKSRQKSRVTYTVNKTKKEKKSYSFGNSSKKTKPLDKIYQCVNML